MHVVVLASRKGGAGKTTLTTHMAVQADISGAGPVAVVDLDPMGGLSTWWNTREAASPIFARVNGSGLSATLDDLRGQGVRTVLIDTPPQATEAIGEVIKLANLVVVPVVPSANDLWAIAETINLVDGAGGRLMFTLNNAGVGTRMKKQAHESLQMLAAANPTRQAVAPIEAACHTRQDFRASMTDGRTATEIDPKGRSAGEIAALWSSVSQALGGAA